AHAGGVRGAVARRGRARPAARRPARRRARHGAAGARVALAAERSLVTRQRLLDASVVAGVVLIGVGLVIDLVTVADGDSTADVLADLALIPVVGAFALL